MAVYDCNSGTYPKVLPNKDWFFCPPPPALDTTNPHADLTPPPDPGPNRKERRKQKAMARKHEQNVRRLLKSWSK